MDRKFYLNALKWFAIVISMALIAFVVAVSTNKSEDTYEFENHSEIPKNNY